MNLFLTADAVRVDSDERGFDLIIDTEDGDKICVNIQRCALDFYDSVRNQMRQWVAEAENARAAVNAGVTLEQYTELDDGWPVPVEAQVDMDLVRDLERGK